VKLVGHVAGAPGHRGETQVQVIEGGFAGHVFPVSFAASGL
jgi:hypothetical protein